MSRTSTSYVTSNTNLHSGSGKVISLIINHAESSTQSVTLYDSLTAAGTVLASFQVSPEASPSQIVFPTPFYLNFTVGLTVEPGNCSVVIQTVGR